MRRIYLIRHAQPQFPTDEKYCIGQTDFPLSKLGKMQAVLLSGWADEILRPCTFFSSPLKRARETADFICENYQVRSGLEEMHAGLWDGLSFSQINKNWPDIFEKRGEDQNIPIPGAEDVEKGLARFKNAVEESLCACESDIAVVAHSTVIQALLSHACGTALNKSRSYKLPYCSLSRLDYDGDFRLVYFGESKTPPMSDRLCLSLLCAAECTESVIAHCKAVCKKALDIENALSKKAYKLDRALIEQSALLHDIARSEKNHASLASYWLSELGYPDISRIIAQHHEHSGDIIDEAAVVYIADKLVRGSTEVGLLSRFEESRKKCLDFEALEAHAARFNAATKIKNKINHICGEEIIA